MGATQLPTFRTAVVDIEQEVDRRLADFGLSRQQFIDIANAARMWADDASPLMPQNAPGTLAYIFGVQELRRQLVDAEWHVDRTGGIEAVVNRSLGMRIGFQNVDRACDPFFPPHPRSAKGAASENLCGPTLFQYFGVEAGHITAVHQDGIETYYVMVGEDSSVELSSPIIQNGIYQNFGERIFISKPASEWDEEINPDSAPVDDFDIAVSFKA